jgi:hypothetical protein
MDNVFIQIGLWKQTKQIYKIIMLAKHLTFWLRAYMDWIAPSKSTNMDIFEKKSQKIYGWYVIKTLISQERELRMK